MKRGASRSQSGFTLLELSVVLTIIAVVVGMSVSMGISMVATARQSATQKKMKAIDDALLQYRIANDRLPCPGDLTIVQGATNFGIEAANMGTCTGGSPAANFTGSGVTNTWQTAAEGAVPAVTLGLSPDLMLDGWGNKFRYAVDVSYTVTGAFTGTGIGCTNGAITVNDGNGNARSAGSIYALISHGANGHGAYTTSGVTINASSSSADELTNCHCNSSGVTTTTSGVQTTKPATYVQKTSAYDSGQAGNSLYYFDDLVTYKERWQLRTDWDKAGGCAYIYVADGGGQRVEIFNMSGTYLGQIGCASGACSAGGGNGQFSGPDGIAIDNSGNVWVVGNSSDWVQKFNSSGILLSGFSFSGTGYGIAIDSSGNLWVTDSGNNRVAKFSTSGSFLMGIGAGYNGVTGSIGSSGTGNGQFNGTSGIAIDKSGNVWVTDSGNNRVEEFNSGGTFLLGIGAGYNGISGSIGSSGSSHGQFNSPGGIAIDAGGNIWVADTYNFRVQEFNSSGTVLMGIGAGYNGVSIGSSGCGNGQMYEPVGISFDSSGNVWVADYGCTRVEEFNSSGTYVSQFGGTWGTANGQFQGVYGIAISSR